MTTAPIEASIEESRSTDGASDDRNHQLTRIAEEVGDLPPLPHVAMRALRIAEQDDWSIGELEKEILRDHALAARLLRLANSPHFGARHTISTIGRALTLIGNKKARSVLMAAAVEGLHTNAKSSFPDKVLWEHALAVASISQHFATACKSANPDDAFMAGLLHDIGRPMMDSLYPDRYREVIGLVEAGDAETFRSAEQQVFGFDHTEVGLLAARGWGLPTVITEVILFHHDPDQAPGNTSLCATVNLANGLCVKNAIGVDKQPDLDLAALPSTEILGLDESQLEELLKTPFADTAHPTAV